MCPIRYKCQRNLAGRPASLGPLCFSRQVESLSFLGRELRQKWPEAAELLNILDQATSFFVACRLPVYRVLKNQSETLGLHRLRDVERVPSPVSPTRLFVRPGAGAWLRRF
jgi:hypothetical protein